MKEGCISCAIARNCKRYHIKGIMQYCPYWYPSHEAEKREDYKNFIENNNLNYNK